jgi:hypothetical protein
MPLQPPAAIHASISEGWKRTGDTVWQNIIALSTLKGEDGKSIVWKGSADSPPANPEVNWAYYDTAQGKSFVYDGTQWGVMTKDGVTPSGAYVKPDDGIPATDLDEAVRASLGKADSAVQTETDPTVSAWAKEAAKPSYTASEVGLGNVDNTSDVAKPVSALTQAALDKKANIYVRLAQGITIGNNIQGMHIMPKEPFTYYTDWTLTSTDGATFVRTDNSLVYTKADSTVVTIVENGEIKIADYAIQEVFQIAGMGGSFTNTNLFYRYFDIRDLDQRIGLVSALLTVDKSSVVNAINSLKEYVDGILESSEVTGSPYASYADFLLGAGATVTPSKYAYVTFTGTDTWPTGGTWDEIVAGETW